jgi:Asp-tRNA(Asn)/Glu-tRNA(Gln) amidotransferase A subunit family amidase
VITAAEGSNLHLADLRTRPQDFDLATRDRFLAGAMVPASWYIQAQRFRQWFRAAVQEVFQDVDVILAPTTPCTAPQIGQEKMTIAGVEMLVRPNLGLFTQPNLVYWLACTLGAVAVERSPAAWCAADCCALPRSCLDAGGSLPRS